VQTGINWSFGRNLLLDLQELLVGSLGGAVGRGGVLGGGVPGIGRGGGVGGGGVSGALALEVIDDGLDDGVVESHGAPGGGELEPEDERGLDGEVVRDVVEDGAEGQALDEGEEPEDSPVGEPLGVVILSGGLDGAVGEVGGEGPSDEVGDGEREGVDEDGGEEEGGGDERAVRLGDLGLGLELVEDRVLAQLLVELGDVLSEALVRLLDGRVGTDLLGSVLSRVGGGGWALEAAFWALAMLALSLSLA